MPASLEVADIFRVAGPNYRATHAGHLSLATGSASWTTQDRCDGTLTKVQTGTVTVRGRHRTVAVHAHHRMPVKRG